MDWTGRGLHCSSVLETGLISCWEDSKHRRVDLGPGASGTDDLLTSFQADVHRLEPSDSAFWRIIRTPVNVYRVWYSERYRTDFSNLLRQNAVFYQN